MGQVACATIEKNCKAESKACVNLRLKAVGVRPAPCPTLPALEQVEPSERTLRICNGEKTPEVLPHANRASLASQTEPKGSIYPWVPPYSSMFIVPIHME